ncbi:MAG TPA: DUF1592 domain-containing protein [Gemmatimonadales bacterium]|nr:DUF1592 domain-containing protein [Gemmatimonadales bacterium]
MRSVGAAILCTVLVSAGPGWHVTPPDTAGGNRLAAPRGSHRSASPSLTASVPSPPPPIAAGPYLHQPDHRPSASAEALTAVVQRICVICHNDRMLAGNLSLASFDVAKAPERAETAEKMIRKLRAGMMPPPGMPRPGGDTLSLLAGELESRLDAAWAARPNPGGRTFQRLNRAEYERSIRELVSLEVNAGDYLPLDTKSANFDNIADVQMLSPTLLEAYLKAAAEISRLAVGDPDAPVSSATYTNSGYVSQWEQVEGAPYGTRGGISVVHSFPADGEYVFQLAFEHTTTGGFYGAVARGERIEVSINGVPAAVLEVDRWMDVSDPNGVNMETDPIFVRAGPQRVTAAFIKTFEGPVEDLLSPHEWSLVDRQIGVDGYGITALAHLKDLVIVGPHNPTGVSETPSRRAIFTCRPTAPAEARPCAEQIIARLAARAFRRPVRSREVAELLAFYEEGARERGFEGGVRMALQAILASPDFVFRLERVPPAAKPGDVHPLTDLDLASRLSFFLWGAPPDEPLLVLAQAGKLSAPAVLREQARRMLADPRSEALGPRFAAQWLRLQDLDKVHPDRLQYPDFYQQLADAMRRETELFFNHLVRADRSALELFTADYTVLNERLARHYGIPGVTGEQFRPVKYPDDTRRGILGHGSILTLTSHANRTSPVLRGKWVMEVLLGTPPPPPPPGVPDLEQTKGEQEGRVLTTRERMELHRANPVCNSCHQFMDPIGLALDNFDVTGRWRIKENGTSLDTRGRMYDGTEVQSPADLQRALLQRPTPLLRTFTANLMAYALGRRVEYYDMPAVRAIVKQAEANGYRMSSFILGVVESDAFRMKQVPAAAASAGTDRP